jgi:hypothetical protein
MQLMSGTKSVPNLRLKAKPTMKSLSRNKLFTLVKMCLAFQLLSACNLLNISNVDIGDGGLLSGAPCSAPCFWNITPGITTKQEAKKIISSELKQYFCWNWDYRNESGFQGISCPNLNVSFDNNEIVNGINFNPTQDIFVDKIIHKYGNPDSIDIFPVGMDQLPPPTLRMQLYYKKQNMIVSLQDQRGYVYDLKPYTLISDISYVKSDEFNSLINTVKRWDGYKEY